MTLAPLWININSMILLSWVAAIIAAMLNTVQAGANAQLNKSLDNPFAATLVVYIAGGVLIPVIWFVASRFMSASFPAQSAMVRTPWWAWLGGCMGLTYVMTMVFFAEKMGSALFSAVTVSVTILTSVVLDHFGWAGFREHAVNGWRVLACVLILSGTFIIAKF